MELPPRPESATVSDERWPQVKALFQAAAERPPSERDAFLAAATGDDEALRREVGSLLNVGRLERNFPRSIVRRPSPSPCHWSSPGSL